MARLILLLLVVGVGLWLYKNSAGGLFGTRPVSSTDAPVGRARTAAATIDRRQAETDRLAGEATSSREAGRVHENMTSSEVRALMGPPDEVLSGFSSNGGPQETWIYRSVGKKVVFEDGVAVRVE